MHGGKKIPKISKEWASKNTFFPNRFRRTFYKGHMTYPDASLSHGQWIGKRDLRASEQLLHQGLGNAAWPRAQSTEENDSHSRTQVLWRHSFQAASQRPKRFCWRIYLLMDIRADISPITSSSPMLEMIRVFRSLFYRGKSWEPGSF